MGLLAPWFLAGAAAVGVPFYLHLLRRHTTTPHPFSSLMFFERRTQSSIKHRRLRYLLLLSLRLAAASAAGAGVCESVHQSLGRQHEQRKTAAGGDRQFLQHARRHAPGRCASARRFRVLASRKPARARAGDGARLAASGAHAADRRMRARCAPPSTASQPGDSRGSFGELGARRALAGRKRPHADRAASLQRHAEIRHAGQLFGTGAARQRLAGAASGGQGRRAELDGGKRQRAGPGLGPEEGARAGGDRRLSTLPRPRARFRWSSTARRSPRKTVDVPANGRATVEFQSLDVPYGFSRCEVRIDSADALPADDASLFAVERSDPQQVLFRSRRGRLALAALFPLRAGLGRGIGLSRWNA